jgi:hypothetical protein
MMGEVRSFLRQPRVQEVVGRMSSLARRLRLQETMSKVPPLVQRWRLRETMGGFYDRSVKPHMEALNRDEHAEAMAELDGIIARGRELRASPDGNDEEQWKVEAIAWLGDGEALLRDKLPDEYRRLTAFAARLSPDTERGRLDQAVSGRLEALTGIRGRRAARPPAARAARHRPF